MYPLVSPEMTSGAVQLAIYFVTALGVLISFMMTARA